MKEHSQPVDSVSRSIQSYLYKLSYIKESVCDVEEIASFREHANLAIILIQSLLVSGFPFKHRSDSIQIFVLDFIKIEPISIHCGSVYWYDKLISY